MHRTLVAIATYNERENLPTLVDAVEAALPEADVLIIDDNSPDGTGRWADERAASDPRLSVIHREGKLGLGSATITAFRWALEREYERVATTDADWSHPPEELPALLALTESCDVAIGSRYAPGGKIEGWPFSRRVISRVMNRLTRFLLRVPVKDSSGAFRVYRASALGRIDLGRISSSGYAYLEEIVWRLAAAGATFAEHPITFRDRTVGSSKANLAEARGKFAMLWRCLTSRA
ncbi:Undecaprenyl-phosphate mannosyltransferase [Planctomycetes bacterium MalM25]|nr:Undecaprenyl-phosphate mannosyltransferase [Planctomycetes bacterium MalM25]